MPTRSPARTSAAEVTLAPWEEFRVQLEDLRSHCLDEGAKSSLTTAGGDPVECSRQARLQIHLDEIEAALTRIHTGTYGICVQCGRRIPSARLQFRPFAPGCVPCSESR